MKRSTIGNHLPESNRRSGRPGFLGDTLSTSYYPYIQYPLGDIVYRDYVSARGFPGFTLEKIGLIAEFIYSHAPVTRQPHCPENLPGDLERFARKPVSFLEIHDVKLHIVNEIPGCSSQNQCIKV
jgi:hypothetical protein